MNYALQDTPLPIEVPPHGKVTTSGLWICNNDDCDGDHHYYVKWSK